MVNYGKYRLDTDHTSLLYSVRRVISIEQEDNLAKQYYWASSSNIQMPNNNKKEKARVKGCVSTTTLRNRHIAGVIDGRRRAFFFLLMWMPICSLLRNLRRNVICSFLKLISDSITCKCLNCATISYTPYLQFAWLFYYLSTIWILSNNLYIFE